MRLRFSQLARRALAVCAALLVASPASASAPGARARLRYRRLAGAESCPAQPAFQAEIAAWLGYDPFSDASARAVDIDLSGAESGLAAHLQLEDTDGKILGERRIQTASSDCRDLTQALVLAVALAVDPLPVTREVIAPSEPAAPPAIQAAPPLVPAPPPARHSGPAAQLSISVGPLGVVLGGPQFSPGLIAGLEARWNHLSIELDGEADAFTGQAWSASGSVQVALVAAELVPCYRSGVFGVCAVLAAGAELGHGEGIPDASSQPLPYVGVGLRLLADLHLAGPLSLRLQVEGLGTALGASFDVGTADAWDTPPVTIQAAAVFALRL